MKKVYSSFAQIDRDLEQLRLQREIGATTWQLRFEETKQSLSPTNMLTDFVAGFARKAIISRLVSKFLRG